MTEPRQAQLPLLLAISEGLSRGTDEMLRVSPQGDAIHPPSCSLAIREAVEEIKWLRAEVERMREEMPVAESLRVDAKCAEIERDEARAVVWKQAKENADLRAEVERLRAEIEALHEALRRGARDLFAVERCTTGPDTPVAFIMEVKP